MITTFKIYENKEDPKIGDYIIVSIKNDSNIARLLNKKIGRITKYSDSKGNFIVKFGTVEFIIKRNEIFDFSDNIKDLEYMIKYNL